MTNRTALFVLLALAGCNRDIAQTAIDGKCGPDQLVGGCIFGRCELSAARGVVPQGAVILASEVAVPPEIAGDAVGPFLCDVTLPEGLDLSAGLTLTITAGAGRDTVLFRYAPPAQSSLIPTSASNGQTVTGVVHASGRYGVTAQPTPWMLSGVSGVEVSASNDAPSLLRNLSSHGFDTAFFDGKRFFGGSRNRLLVWDGLPGPTTPPTLVLGQPDLDHDLTGLATSSVFDNTVTGIFSDGASLAVSTGNRVLIWKTLPRASFTPADLVLGQSDFSTNAANAGGIGAGTLAAPAQIDFDGAHFAVADQLNHRVLVWRGLPSLIGQPADFVIGQPGFTGDRAGAGAMPLRLPVGVLLDRGGAWVGSTFDYGLAYTSSVGMNNPPADVHPVAVGAAVQPGNIVVVGGLARLVNGGLAARDALAQRVAIFRAPPAGPAQMDMVLGQPDPLRSVLLPTSASYLTHPFDGSYVPTSLGGGAVLAVPDGLFRVLVWEHAPAYNFDPADRVIGQAGFSTNERGVDYRGISASTLAAPAAVSGAGGLLAVADRGNNRVLIYDAAALRSGQAAMTVVGQPDEKSFVPDLDQRTPDAARLSGPSAVSLDGTHLVVADTENHRVLIWSRPPAKPGTPADLVLGQRDFSAHRPNAGRGDDSPKDGYSDAGADGFFYPAGVASDGKHLFVADRLNHRVLVWRTFPTQSGQPADAVIGQASFTANLPNRGNGPGVVAASGLDLPSALALDDNGALWIADTENNRVVRYVDPAGAARPDLVLGQGDLSTLANPNTAPPGEINAGVWRRNPTTASSVLHPIGVTVAGGRVYVSEWDSNRVHAFDLARPTQGGLSLESVAYLGQINDTGAAPNRGGISASAISLPAGLFSDGKRLFVADSANHRVLAFDLTQPPATGSAAALALGQPSLLTNGFNQSSTAGSGATSRPRGISLTKDTLFVADSGNHRVLAFGLPLVAGAKPLAVYGQPDATLALPNAGGNVSARSLKSPSGVFADDTRLLVADTGNDRVVLYDRGAMDHVAVVALGQPDLTSAGAGTPGAATLDGPEAAITDGTRVFVADTSNHRVLIWKKIPAASGVPADLVLGQSGFDGAKPNRGANVAGADTLALPSGLALVGGALLVADTGNNRVLRWNTLPQASGAPADIVYGQPDFTSRGASSDPLAADRLAGPIGLASDGTNLYVADRDLSRVVVFRGDDLTSPGTVVDVIYGTRGLSLHGAVGLAAAPTPLFTTRLFIADTRFDRLLVVDKLTRLATR